MNNQFGANVSLQPIQVRAVLYDRTIAVTGDIIDVTDIPQNYDHLEIIFRGSASAPNTDTSLYCYFNNDRNDSNYGFMQVYNSGSFNNALAGGVCGYTHGTSYAAALATNYIGTMLNYSSPVTYKSLVGQSYTPFDTSSSGYNMFRPMEWKSLTPITRISFFGNNSGSIGLVAGSRFQLIGLRTELWPISTN